MKIGCRTPAAWGVLLCLAGLAVPAARAVADDAPPDESIWERDRLLGDLGGPRARLEDAGVKFGLQDQSEGLGDVAGGVRRGVIYDGASQASVTVDTDKAFGLAGGTFYVSAYQIRGRGASANLVGNLQTVSGIEATRATRLYDLYYEQTARDGLFSVRLGQMRADDEFIVSSYAALFINSSFGWPTLAALDLPSGGPAYPLATPAVRLKLKPSGNLTLLAAVFNGNPAGAGAGDPQQRDNSGTTLRVNSGQFAIAELDFSVNQGDGATGLAGTYRIGAWYSTIAAGDLRTDGNGVSLASPNSTGTPRRRDGDWSLYAIADQMLWRQGESADQGIGAFAKVAGAPGDRNLVQFQVLGGLSWKGALPGRDADTAGIGLSYIRIGAHARAFDGDIAAFSGRPYPRRDGELVVEATYSCQAAGWLMLQPDLQYVVHPGGNIPDPLAPARRLPNALVIGTRATVTF